jgi:hypothetical protein
MNFCQNKEHFGPGLGPDKPCPYCPDVQSSSDLLPSDLYRKYFVDIRKFKPFPMTVSYENVLDFVEWLKRQ